jgi:hypothetical protein
VVFAHIGRGNWLSHGQRVDGVQPVITFQRLQDRQRLLARR